MTNMTTTKRSKSVLALGWFWLLFSSISLIETAFDFGKILKKKEVLQKLVTNPPKELENIVELITPLSQNLYTLVFLKIALAVIGIIAALKFLRLRKWGQNILEGLSWVYVLFIILFVVLLFKFNASAIADGQHLRASNNSFIIFGMFSIPFLLSGIMLRKKKYYNTP